MVFSCIWGKLYFEEKPEAANLVQTSFKFTQDPVFRKVESRFRFMWKWTLHFSVRKHILILLKHQTNLFTNELRYMLFRETDKRSSVSVCHFTRVYFTIYLL
jgi:hypothetical protein